MFEPLEAIVRTLTMALYSQSDAAIAAMCDWSWNNLFGWIAGLVLGFGLLQMLLEDELMDGIRRLTIQVITMLILAWFIKPGPGGCKMVQVKGDALAMRTSITGIIAPGWGGDPSDSITKTTEQMRKYMDLLIRAASHTLVQPLAEEIVAKKPNPLTPEELAVKATQKYLCSDIGAHPDSIYCR